MKRALAAALAALLASGTWAADKPKPKPAAPPAPVAPPQELRILQKVMPNYALGAGVADGGCVTVKFQIRHDGFVGDITVLEAKPEALAEPTVAALKQWLFQSFPPPDLYAVQTFSFTPEQVRLPDDAIRSPYALATEAGAVVNAGCGAGKSDKVPDKADQPKAKG